MIITFFCDNIDNNKIVICLNYVNGEQIKLLSKKFDINIDIEMLENMNKEYIFKDIDINEQEYINQGIDEFLEISNIDRNELLKDNIIKKLLIEYLNNKWKITYVSIMRNLNITKGQMEKMKKR